MLKNRLAVFAIVFSAAFIYALATYSGMAWADVGAFAWATLQLLIAMFVLALMLAFVIRGIKKLFGLTGDPQDEEPPNGRE